MDLQKSDILGKYYCLLILHRLFVSHIGLSLSRVPTYNEVFFAQFLTMRKKVILARDIEIQKENWG